MNAADLHLCFCICEKHGFSQCDSYTVGIQATRTTQNLSNLSSVKTVSKFSFREFRRLMTLNLRQKFTI